MKKKNLILGGIIAVLVMGNIYFYGLANEGLRLWEENETKYEENLKLLEEKDNQLDLGRKQLEIIEKDEAIKDEMIEIMEKVVKIMEKYMYGEIDDLEVELERKIYFAELEELVLKRIKLETEYENLE